MKRDRALSSQLVVRCTKVDVHSVPSTEPI